ncbi:hypothetical protein GTP46_12705 [Duganella sp. FT135W]|uniref:DUF2029 domain-containing protein n=1 Tax=Duganella flavida TaxID=2692175 RepID=A0A6L8K7P2_9BURK|nr:hypothetical protein [Duganella flavida]MYM23509.1 hypothetical protein [Duganella flavida]
MTTSAALTRKQLLILIGGFAALALLVMIWRWGGTVEDSLAYFNTARYLRGEIPASELRAPFPYRLLAPALAAAIPGDTRQSFALLNWLCISATAVMMTLAALRAGIGRKGAVIAGLLLLLSVPTFWYAPYLLTDPASLCARAAFVLAVLSGQPWLAAVAGVAGAAVREENILLLVWLLAMRRIAIMPGLVALAAAGAWMVAVRWWLIPGLPSYVWAPSIYTVITALKDVRSLASLVTAAGLVLPLALLGMRGSASSAPALQPLKSLLLLMVLPPLYAALCVRIDGRAIWGLYPMLAPFAALWLAARLEQWTPAKVPA